MITQCYNIAYLAYKLEDSLQAGRGRRRGFDMTTRGIRKPGVSMVTKRMLGSCRDDPTTRREFLAVIESPSGGSNDV